MSREQALLTSSTGIVVQRGVNDCRPHPPGARYARQIRTSTPRSLNIEFWRTTTKEYASAPRIKLKKEIVTRYAPDDFIPALSDHVPDHYRHAIRHFGLLAPRAKRCTFGTLFAQLGQRRRLKPRHLSWAKSIEREFKVDPLRDSKGEHMRLIARRRPGPATASPTRSYQLYFGRPPTSRHEMAFPKIRRGLLVTLERKSNIDFP